MGMFQWLMKKITKVFGRSTNSLFYSLLYREILNEINLITGKEDESVIILREIGKKAGIESCERHSSIFKFMPGNPEKVLDYFEILWVVVFGKEIEELSYETIKKEDSQYNDYILKIKNCPICAGYGTSSEDRFDVSKLDKESEGMACGLCGMLESVANYILKVKNNEYRIIIEEQKCIAKGEPHLELLCKIYDYNEWKKISEEKVRNKVTSKIDLEEEVEKDIPQEKKLDFIDKLQDVISLDKLEELLDEPLENIKKQVADLIRDKLGMEPEHFFDYFKNYEDDLIRIIGFLGVHLLNEYGNILEKTLKNDIFAKVIGYLFKQTKEMVLLFIPLDVINDYHKLLVNFLDGLASNEMLDNIRTYSGKDDLNFFFEGAQIALKDLGIEFTELEGNIWEELNKQRENGLISSGRDSVDEAKEKLPIIINIIQEILMLINHILTLPIRVLISESHYGLKTAINSVVSEEEGLVGAIKDRFDNIFDHVQELRQ
jgi:hypothetical protein